MKSSKVLGIAFFEALPLLALQTIYLNIEILGVKILVWIEPKPVSE